MLEWKHHTASSDGSYYMIWIPRFVDSPEVLSHGCQPALSDLRLTHCLLSSVQLFLNETSLAVRKARFLAPGYLVHDETWQKVHLISQLEISCPPPHILLLGRRKAELTLVS